MVLPAFPMPTKGRARQGFLTVEEVERLCHLLPPHAVNAVHFAWETGWRRGEIFGLRWQDVDMSAGIIFLTDSKNGEPRQLPFADSDVLARIIRCAVERRTSSAGESPARQLSLQPVAIGASREATNSTEPSM
jgi:integrase